VDARPLWKANLKLAAFGHTKIPMIGYVRPRLVAAGDDVVVRIPLGRRTRNHLGSMYFGALAVGADLAAGWTVMAAARDERNASGRRVDFVFKDAHSEFLRRPDGHVHFTCRDGMAIRALVARAVASGQREELGVEVVATVPSRTEPVARFAMTLSVKARA
jgi:acyl-coenzyme A thioesterase PaaI-like protein